MIFYNSNELILTKINLNSKYSTEEIKFLGWYFMN